MMTKEKHQKKSRETPIPATYTVNDVENLQDPTQDWQTAYALIRAHKIRKPKSMTTLYEFKQILLDHLKGLNEVPGPDKFLSKVVVFQQKREFVERVYNHLREFAGMSECTESVKATIHGRVRDWENMLRDHSTKLQSEKSCPILVAGEAGAGKSSFINLMIGADILPVDDALSTTSCICEIHHNEKKRVLAYPIAESSVVKDLLLDGKTESDVREILSQFAHEAPGKDEDTLKYGRVEIHWPIPFLRAGLFLVDSPGVGERSVMTTRTKSYMQYAVAFIYILNSEAAGGFAPGRLDDLLAMKTEQTDGSKLRTFNPESALFIFNKWEKTNEDTRAKIKDQVLDRLKWPGLNLETQVHYLSVKVANTCRTRRLRLPDEYVQFLDVFHAFLEIGLENDITSHLRWLDYLMNHLETCIKTPLIHAKQTRENNHERIAGISERLRMLEEDSMVIVRKYYDKLSIKTGQIAMELHVHLQKPETFEKLKDSAWHAELPTDEDMMINEAIIVEVIRKLFMAETSNWEDETHMIEDIKEEILAEFMTEFKIISDELARIEQDMKGTTNYLPRFPPIPADYTHKKTPKNLGSRIFAYSLLLFLFTPAYLVMLAGFMMTPIIGTVVFIKRMPAAARFFRYKNSQQDRREAMEKLLFEYTKNLTVPDVERDIAAVLMKEVEHFIRRLELDLPRIIESSESLLGDVRDCDRSASEIVKQYEPLMLKLNLAFGLRNLFYFKYRLPNEPGVRSDITMIKHHERLTSGTFAVIFNSWLDEVKVTIKKFRAVLDENNVTNILLQRDLLCQMGEHCNIIDLHGTIYSNGIDGKRLMFIFEYCDETLQQAIFQNSDRIPANHSAHADRKKAMEYILDKLVQISGGLSYLHCMRCVYGDLKLENILLRNGCVKLSDLAHEKAKCFIGPDDQNLASTFGRYASTPQYTDPNILKERYVQTEADVYSLALVMWESWFGQDVYNGHWDEQLAEKVKNGHRPGLDQPGIRPFEDFQNLMKICWCEDAYNRPVMREVGEVLKEIQDAAASDRDLDDLSFTRCLLVKKDKSFLLDSVSDSIDGTESFLQSWDIIL